MACIEMPNTKGDSEMEEGEIVDEADELSDISSEEEFLLRQRLQVLENYNNVLERKQAKRNSNGSSIFTNNGKRPRNEEIILCDLSEVSETDFEDNNINIPHRIIKNTVPVKYSKRKKQTKEALKVSKKTKETKKNVKQDKKKKLYKTYIKSSDDSDDEYFNKRRRLANAVTLKKAKNDTSTLKDRISRMLFGSKKSSNIIELKHPITLATRIDVDNSLSDVNTVKGNNHKVINIESSTDVHYEEKKSTAVNTKSDNVQQNDITINEESFSQNPNFRDSNKFINLCTDNESSQDAADSAVCQKEISDKNAANENKSDPSSDEDLELLREYALKTKSSKPKNDKSIEIANSEKSKPHIASEDEDSDTAELRLICLKSTILKKAIEIKQKQKLKKRLSQSSCLQNEITFHEDVINGKSDNNTDIESVDMDIGSDGEEKAKENLNTLKIDSQLNNNLSIERNQDNELEDDEDLLRAKLLTSLSKNLPNLVDLSVFNLPKQELKNTKEDEAPKMPVNIPEEKKIIIKLGESDSEGEHEETKNLTKMHLKLAEHYQDFQSKLDTLLKSTRQEFEKETSAPDVIETSLQKPVEKFIPKAMNHLPKSEQVEYKNLVKRMAELEKIKQARSSLMSSQNKTVKETLKLRNTSVNTLKSAYNLEEKFALSRKKIAEESAKILKLKEEAKKLTQKYKIVATELKNISTAINLNKKQQRAVHSNLQKIRLQHQLLLKGATYNLNTISTSNRLSKVQKENNPSAEDSNLLKSVKVSVVNDSNTSVAQSRLSVLLDVANNKKTVKLPKIPPKGRVVDIVPNTDPKTSTDSIVNKSEGEPNTSHLMAVESGGISNEDTTEVHVSVIVENKAKKNDDNYESPLAALGSTTWKEDPNAFLCPYEVGGSCRDPDCNYLHPKIPSHQ